MIGIINKIFIVLLSNIASALIHTKFISLSNQTCQIHPTLINLNPNEYRQEFH